MLVWNVLGIKIQVVFSWALPMIDLRCIKRYNPSGYRVARVTVLASPGSAVAELSGSVVVPPQTSSEGVTASVTAVNLGSCGHPFGRFAHRISLHLCKTSMASFWVRARVKLTTEPVCLVAKQTCCLRKNKASLNATRGSWPYY